MTRITVQRKLRKFAGANINPAKHYEWVDYEGIRFPILMSPGQIVNIRKAYDRWMKEQKVKLKVQIPVKEVKEWVGSKGII